MKYFMGIDAGLTKIKAAVYDESGTLLRCAERPAPLEGDLMDMELQWRAVAECIEETGAGDVAAIGTAGHGNGMYPLDAEGRPFMKAISSMTSLPAGNPDDKWAGHTINLIKYFADKGEDRISKVLFCKDWIKYRLTGRITTDYTDISFGGALKPPVKSGAAEKPGASGKDTAGRTGVNGESHSIYADAAYESLFPQPVKSTACAGFYKGIPVTGGMIDVNSCVIGSGVTEPGKYSIISGTWGINSCIVPEYKDSRDFLQCCVFDGEGKYICIESGPTSSVNLDWFIGNVIGGMDCRDADEIAGKTPTDIIFLPFIYGTARNQSARGAFLNLGAGHTAAHMIRAVFEGVAMMHRFQVEKLKKAGFEYKGAIMSGGAAKSVVWRKIFADVTGLEIEASMAKQAGTLGGAICGAVMLGIYPGLTSAAEAMTGKGEKYYPDPAAALDYEKKYRIFREVTDKWNLS